MRTYRQITYEELVKIETYLEEGLKKADIAIRLERNKSTIGRVIGKSVDDKFSAEVVWRTICERKREVNTHHVIFAF
ncbi:MAG: helix-turn-helix domain-containing protein [Candidatus Peregrinibacteria bacterium]|nr:helix-turn-helix domain-containing protein [Candidatus Peregrinibacteria bacterium]MDZ4244718.1 helix-turn-helix domain-containing protein [Candidatus Gracilibacteria bacterium]